MLNRPRFEDIYMSLSQGFANRSTCSRLKVGCVITNSEFTMVLSVGYNGNAKGEPNKCDRDEPGNCGCIHAEVNALIKLNSKVSEKKIAFVTHLPCPMCSKLFINKGGFEKIYYINEYRISESKELLERHNIRVEKMEWQNKSTTAC